MLSFYSHPTGKAKNFSEFPAEFLGTMGAVEAKGIQTALKSSVGPWLPQESKEVIWSAQKAIHKT